MVESVEERRIDIERVAIEGKRNGKGKAKDKEIGEHKWASSDLRQEETWHHEEGQ